MNDLKPGIIYFEKKENKHLIQSIKGSLEIEENLNISDIEVGTIIGFRVSDRGKVYSIFKASECESDFRKNKTTYDHYEWALILKSNDKLLQEEILSEVESRHNFCIEIVNDYLKENNLKSILNNYSVELTLFERHKLGGDDTLILTLKDRWKNKKDFNMEFNKEIEGNLVIFKDAYIHKLFPEFREVLFSARDYFASRMYQDFMNKNREKVKKTEKRAIKLTKEIRENAIKKYDLEAHTNYLLENVNKKLFIHRDFILKYNYFRYLEDYWTYEKLTGEIAYTND